MKTTTKSGMARLTAARPSVADQTEGIVPRSERTRLLRSIVEAPSLPAPPASSAPALRRQAEPDHNRAWADATTSFRRRALAGAFGVAAVATALVVAGVVGAGDESAQVNAGTGEGPTLPALAPDPPTMSYAPTGLPGDLVLQEVAVEPAVPPLPGSPRTEVYGRMSPDGAIEAAVAVITATAPDFIDALVRDSGATTSPVPGQAELLDIDFGQGLVGRSYAADPTETVCGTGGCVEIVSQIPSYMVLGRDLEGGAAALPGIIEDLVFTADDRMAPALVLVLADDGFKKIYEGDQVPGLASGPQTVLRYGDESGALGLTLRIEEGHDFDPASIAWQFPKTRTVEVRGHDGLLVANDLLTSVTWQERPGLTLSLDVTGFTEKEALDLANGVEEVGEAP